MKQGLIWIVCLALLGACRPSGAQMTIEQKHQVETEVKHASEAAQTLDHERYFSFFDKNDLTIMNPDGST